MIHLLSINYFGHYDSAGVVSVVDTSLSLTSDSTSVSDQVGESGYRNGLYFTSASSSYSYSGTSKPAYYSFDNSVSTYWHCMDSASSNYYSQQPYLGSFYHGGGTGYYYNTAMRIYRVNGFKSNYLIHYLLVIFLLLVEMVIQIDFQGSFM